VCEKSRPPPGFDPRTVCDFVACTEFTNVAAGRVGHP
jgi:hypothetical protein